MEHVRSHFDSEADQFDGIIIQLIPYYTTMIGALVDAIPYPKTKPIRVLDLGCGTGTVARSIADSFPQATLICLDMSPRMIDMAKRKMADRSDTEYLVSDFSRYEFPHETFDAVVSSLALHHLATNEEKCALYRQIFAALKSGGIFLNADEVLGPTPHLDRLYVERWSDFMRQNVSESELRKEWLQRYETEDHPAPLGRHLHWLEKAGFEHVETIWKYFNFAVYGGLKPVRPVEEWIDKALRAEAEPPVTEPVPSSAPLANLVP